VQRNKLQLNTMQIIAERSMKRRKIHMSHKFNG